MATEFDTYRIYYQSAPQYSWQSRVYLYNNSSYVGRIMFMKPGIDLPANSEQHDRHVIHFPTSEFENIMEILRNEKPLYIHVVDSNGIGTISTSSEPVGEEED